MDNYSMGVHAAYQRDMVEMNRTILALQARNAQLEQGARQALDELENLILSAGGNVKMAQLLPATAPQHLAQVDVLLGEMLTRVLAIKKHLNISSTLSIEEQEDK